MRKSRSFVIFSLALAFATAVTALPAAGYDAAVVAEAATLKLNQKAISLEQGDTYRLKVKGSGKKKVKWSSSDPEVAKVGKKGKVTAVSEGNAIVSAKVGKKTLKCTVTVTVAMIEDDDSGSDGSQTGESVGDYYDRISDYIAANGRTMENGNLVVSQQVSAAGSAVILAIVKSTSDGYIMFTYSMSKDKATVVDVFGMNRDGMSQLVTTMASVDGNQLFDAVSDELDPSSYVDDSTVLHFTDSIGLLDEEKVDQFSNTTFSLSLGLFDGYLQEQFGFGMKELGFSNL